jgi:methylaspartate ammonia-lyase
VGVFLDLKKAFDVVPHNILLKKLEKLGIRGVALRWFSSYLEGRSQRVEIDGQLSDVEAITISILQGSILGPILFLCFINDLPNCTDLLTLLFADDTAGLYPARN